jgi:ubiquitin-like modifier-activating enzyme ATG7
MDKLEKWDSFWKDQDKVTIGVIDYATNNYPGWYIRNVLQMLETRFNISNKTIEQYCLREKKIESCILININLLNTSSEKICVGWESGVNGSLTPRIADLAPMMDPKQFMLLTKIG